MNVRRLAYAAKVGASCVAVIMHGRVEVNLVDNRNPLGTDTDQVG